MRHTAIVLHSFPILALCCNLLAYTTEAGRVGRWGGAAYGGLPGIKFPNKRRFVGTAGDETPYLLPTDFGIDHYQIMGSINNETVVLHMFVRFSGRLVQRHFYGKAWFEYVEGTDFMPLHSRQHNHFPTISLQGVGTGRVHRLTHVTNPYYCIHVEGSFRDNSTSYELLIEGWKRSLYLRPVERREMTPHRHVHDLNELPQVVGVYAPIDFLHRSASHTVKLLAYNLEYHRRFGYSGFIVYLRPHALEAALRSPTIRRLAEEGVLTLVYWDVFPMHGRGHYTDQWPSYYHATVALSGEHVMVHFNDLDEFLATDHEVSSVQQLLRGCLGDRGHHRFFVQDFRMPASVVNSSGPYKIEADVWASPEVADPLKLYSEYVLPLWPGTNDPFFFKYLASPAVLLNFNNHHVNVKEEAQSWEVPTSCAYVTHLACVFWRRGDNAKWKKNSQWFYLHSDDTIVI